MENRMTAGPLSLELPSGWEPGPGIAGTDAIALAPADSAGGFRPNLVVNSEPFSGSTAKLSTVVLATHQVTMSDYHLIDVEAWDGLASEGRRFEFMHRQGGLLLHCIQYTASLNGLATHVTFSCAEDQLARWDAALLECAETIGASA
ncbi:hypothetical protein [Paeniglutamicibacter cryotolerans]|uniref:DUF1795 domain-containing protein n=1 Tax=Paeniglutamicibacter cryotolerans TaxID=670079 RepID=A0A839QEQ6_9MICC|nr:hypothetical protein [Paeniglutamicibacter cryotolerans]MBB2994629.1 hypothetical protein [Paeniglutamicibacter cryotolerans]